MTTTDPFAEAWQDYWDAGWRGVLPLPFRAKKSPPGGFTGYGATDPSYADCMAWADDGPHNVALHLPDTVVGIDVDAYGGKPGARTLAELVEAHGPLPPTWLSSSRGDGISGIRLFRLPEPMRLINALPGIEIIQAHHRYVVAAPSVHPEGGVYQWVNEADGTVGEVPQVDELPELPAGWLQRLTAPEQTGVKVDIGADAVLATLAQMPGGQPCGHILQAAGRAVGSQENRHDSFNAAVMAIVGAGRRGCPGALATLTRLQETFIAEVTTVAVTKRTRAEAINEWQRSLAGAVALVADEPQGQTCPDEWMDWVTGDGGQADDDAGDEANDLDDEAEARFAYDRAVERRAAELQLADDARALLATRRAGRAPALEAVGLSAFLAQPDEPVAYRVDRLWPVDGRVLLAAAAKAGKTTLVMNLLGALADGGDFLGCYPTEPLTDGVVVYLNLEVSANQMRRWLRRAGIVATDRIVVENLRGRVSALTLATEQGRQKVAGWLRGLDARVVILDPLAPMLASLGLDENSNTDVAQFFSWWSETLRMAGVSEDFIAHHAGHDGGRSRGASRLMDEPDALWTIARDNAVDDDGDAIFDGPEPRFFKASGRDVEEPESLLEFDGATGQLSVGEGSRKAVRRATEAAKYRAAIRARLAGGQATQNDLCRRLGLTYGKVKEALEGMVDDGSIARWKVGQGYIYALSEPTPQPTPQPTPDEKKVGVSHRHTPRRGVGATDVPVSDAPVSVRSCEDCGGDTGSAGFRICAGCEQKRRQQ